MLLKCLISSLRVICYGTKNFRCSKNGKWHLMHFCMIHSIIRLFVYMREKISQVFCASPSHLVLVESWIAFLSCDNLIIVFRVISSLFPQSKWRIYAVSKKQKIISQDSRYQHTNVVNRIIHLIQWKMCCFIKVNHWRTVIFSFFLLGKRLGPLIAFSASSMATMHTSINKSKG